MRARRRKPQRRSEMAEGARHSLVPSLILCTAKGRGRGNPAALSVSVTPQHGARRSKCIIPADGIREINSGEICTRSVNSIKI